MKNKEQAERLMQQISGQHVALAQAYGDLAAAYARGVDVDIENLKQAADLYWQLRAVVGALAAPEAASGAGAIDLV